MFKFSFIFGSKQGVFSRFWWSAVLLLGLCLEMGAQQAADARLNVVLNDVQSIAVNQDQSDISISLNSAQEYSEGKSTVKTDHFQVVSSSEYEIKVSAVSQLQGNSESIPVSTVGIAASLGNGGALTDPVVFSNVNNLSTSSQTIVQSDQGTIGRSFNVEYKISGGPDYLNKPAGVYSTTIVYSVFPK